MMRAFTFCLPLLLMACTPSPISIGENNLGNGEQDLAGTSMEGGAALDAALPPDSSTDDDMTRPEGDDLAMPDLRVPDQAAPDLPVPDLAAPDLLVSDLARPPDLAAPGDLAVSLAVTPGVAPVSMPLLLPQAPIGDLSARGRSGFAIGDVNNDGRLDIAAISGDVLPLNLSVALADGPQSFSVTKFASLGWTHRNIGKMGNCCLLSDTNNDGKLDLSFSVYLINNGGLATNALLGNGDGTFQQSWAPVPGNVPAPAWVMTTGDFDGDGNADKAESQQNGISIGMSDGKGGFHSITSFPWYMGYWLRATDMNGDGVDDLVVQGDAIDAYSLGVLYGRRAGSLLPATWIDSQALGVPVQVAGGDFDRDGKDDLASLGDKSTRLSLFLSKGDGTFAPESLVMAGTAPRSLAVADFNGDGKPDVVTANTSSKDLTVLLGKGDGTFQAPIATPVAAAPTSVVAADLDGNGKVDVAAMTAAELLFFSGKGDGTFLDAQATAGFAAQTRLLSGDVNGDGRVDLLAAPLAPIPYQAPSGGRLSGQRQRDLPARGAGPLRLGLVAGRPRRRWRRRPGDLRVPRTVRQG